jgi:hypothetical protein
MPNAPYRSQNIHIYTLNVHWSVLTAKRHCNQGCASVHIANFCIAQYIGEAEQESWAHQQGTYITYHRIAGLQMWSNG